MNDPIRIYNEITEAYLKYIDSGLPFFHKEYNDSRDELLREDGTISQPPIIELVQKYHEKASLREFCQRESVSMDVNDFVNSGLFANGSHVERRLYDHQYEALREAFINRKNVIVTTGTGSGKTECFLLPVIADLVTESAQWRTGRTRAIRTLILYPLNALVEDQMIRLRKALNSRRPDRSGALDWLDSHRSGNRFYFGRYTGSTPVSGTREKSASRLREEKLGLQKGWNAAKEAAAEDGRQDLLFHVPCMEGDSAEMWNRFDMQDAAPDILITNYSMLNIMLMREAESQMFEDTRKWLAEDNKHVFHLVIDELHTYRGTSGTEVAYLIRVLLERLGLTPDSPQIQFLATSASMEEDQQSADYLCEFFGIEKENFRSSFAVLSNPRQPETGEPEAVLPQKELAEYCISHDEQKLLASCQCGSISEVCSKYRLVDWLKHSLSSDHGLIARDIRKIAFAMHLTGEDGLKAASAIIQIICRSRDSQGSCVAPLRAHFFFRNLSGLWACSDPNCTECHDDELFPGRLAGRLYKRPRTVCSCGKKVLEVLVCENCGELYLGGYMEERDGRYFLSSERPVGKTGLKYCVLWQGKTESKDWERVSYDPATGECTNDINGEYLLYERQSSDDPELPAQCPKCEVSYQTSCSSSFTPIRHHSTGLQKVNQILADALIRSMRNAGEKNTKLVLFSDSRQAAAKLSAGIELDHYLDVLRWAILKSLGDNETTVSYLKQLGRKQGPLTIDERQKVRSLMKNPAYHDDAETVFWGKDEGSTEEDQAKLKSFLASGDGQQLSSVESKVFTALLKTGTNPAGPKPSVNHNQYANVTWSDIYDFKQFKEKEHLTDAEINFDQHIHESNRIEQLRSIFSNKKRSFEELKLGYLAPSASVQDHTFRELVCSAIRILGEKRRIRGIPSRYPYTDSFPKNVRNLIKEVYQTTSLAGVNKVIDKLKSFMRDNEIIDKNTVTLTGKGLTFVKAEAGAKYWICPRCKTVHMQHSNGVCINCFSKLGEPSVLTKEDVEHPDDYYLSLLKSMENAYRLHCEELTGQTSKKDSQDRQRLFQDIFLKDENPAVQGIDLLSVTTTMEAGVDIGSLSAVMMGNVPPQRFNYQQRVGRAGRRGNPLSIALTVAKGTSHDLAHFFEYERMVSEPPKDPYLEVRTPEIAERIIYKELLYESLRGEVPVSNESVHGNFGKAREWDSKYRPVVESWIKESGERIDQIVQTVTRATSIYHAQQDEIKKFIRYGLTQQISDIAKSADYNQEFLSERLANAGLLPMFGFPTRVRNLYLKAPAKLPAEEDVVMRDVDMAMNSFAPGHEIVVDKKVYRSVGIVDYEYKPGHSVGPKFNSLNEYQNPMMRCPACGYSTINKQDESDECPVCGARMNRISICSPLGFCVDYTAPAQDFNGNFDWYSPNSEIKLDCEESLTECPQVRNMRIMNNQVPSQGLVHLINDNNGALYELGRNSDNIYIARSAYPENLRKNLKLYKEKRYAFVSSKTTGVLTLSIDQVPEELNLSPLQKENKNSFAVRAAFLSWGYLVRKAIASYLDIDASELNVGYYITPDSKKAEVFFVERLENGAGYCNFLSGRKYSDVPEKAILDPLKKGGELYEMLLRPSHLHGCTSSCYDCIRDFSNQEVHGLLDWRLGLDLARLADDCNAKVDFSIDYWSEFINKDVRNVLISNGFKVSNAAGTLVGCSDSENVCIVHPLWSEEYVSSLIGDMKECPRPLSVYDISNVSV